MPAARGREPWERSKVEKRGGPGGGDARIDWYFTWIRGVGETLVPNSTVVWLVRAVLLVALVVHVTGVIQLFRRNRAARPANRILL